MESKFNGLGCYKVLVDQMAGVLQAFSNIKTITSGERISVYVGNGELVIEWN